MYKPGNELISFIAVNYNSQEETDNYIRSVLSLTKHDISIIIVVVDNSGNYILDDNYNHRIRVIRPGNVGYFAGLNVGIKFLQNAGLNLNAAVVGNNDLEFESDFLTNLINCLGNHFVIAPRITNLDGYEQNPHVIIDLSKWRLRYLKIVYSHYWFWLVIPRLMHYLLPRHLLRKDETQFSRPQFIQQGHGSCLVLTERYLKDFEYLPEETFMYGEEFFISNQLSKKGKRIYYEPALRVVHKEHSSISKGSRRSLFKMQLEGFRRELELRKIIKDGSL